MIAARRSVVIVDDNPDDRVEVRRMLRVGTEVFHHIREAETGAECLASCLEHPHGVPDCVILDYHLPDMSALEVIAALGAGRANTACAVLVLTGDSATLSGHELIRAGAQDYLDKSWLNPGALARAVDNAIERHRMTGEAIATHAALQESKGRLRLALQASDTGLWTWHIDSDTVSWSPECARIYDIVEGSFGGRGQDFFALIHDDDRDGVERTVRAAIDQQQPYDCEFRIVRPHGEVVWVSSRARATYDAAGRPLRVFGSITDISKRKLAETALRDADRRKDEFLATLAHELRNPLAPLRLGLDLLARAAPGQDTSRVRGMMDRQVTGLVRLIDDLLDVSRITSGKFTLQRERLDLRQVVELAVETCQPVIDAARHTLELRLLEGPLMVDGDLTRLTQVLGNLINNAAKYTPRGGCIVVTAAAIDGEAVLRVEDNGSGIPSEMLGRVFEMFTQVEGASSRSQGGLGIGLSLVKNLVAMHGGQVSAASAGPGAGSTFTVCLALAAPATAADTDRHARAAIVGSSRRVLVVDDNVDAADSLAHLLQLSGHDAHAAHDGVEALAIARGLRPEVVFVDLTMPGIDGYEVARRLRSDVELSQGLLIALTGLGSDDDRRRSRDAGFDIHLTKPVAPEVVEEILARPSP